MSYTRLRMSAMVSSSSSDMLNLAKSGLKVTQVQFSEALHDTIFGSPFWLMLSVNTCTNRCKHFLYKGEVRPAVWPEVRAATSRYKA